jgi:hypothetical protein
VQSSILDLIDCICTGLEVDLRALSLAVGSESS